MVDPFGLCGENAGDAGEKSRYRWLHTALNLAGPVFDGADIVNAGIYALEGRWGAAAVCIASVLPVVGTAITGVTKATRYARAGTMIGKTLQAAGKTYTTVQTATAALEMAGDARMQYAVNGGNVTPELAMKAAGAAVMGAMAVLSATSMMKDVTSLTRTGDVRFETTGRDAADAVSGRCEGGTGVGCFVAGTRVKTQDGEKNIEEVEEGDYVLSGDPETGEQEYKRVVTTYIHEKYLLVHIYVEEEEITATENHPFYAEGLGFVSAGTLHAGDIVRLADGRRDPVRDVEFEYLDEPVLVYNFEVEDFHTYYVSGIGVLVHNICEGGSNSPISLKQALKNQDKSGVRPGQTEIHTSQLNNVINEIQNNYNPSKAYSSIYSDGANRYIVEGHHTTVAFEMLGKDSAINMNTATSDLPSSTNIYWSKKWYQFWRKTIKVVED